MAVESEYLAEVRAELWRRDTFSFIPNRDLPAPPHLGRMGGGLRFVFFGFPSDYSLAFLLALIDLDVELVGIVTSPGSHPAISGNNALSRIAGHLKVPLLRAWRINDLHSRMELADLQPDVVVLASFDQILSRATIAVPRLGWINIHPSLLPHHRGPDAVYWTIAEGEKSTGVTAYHCQPEVDAGPVIAQTAVEVRPNDTAGMLTRRICAVGTAMLPDAVTAVLGGFTGRPINAAEDSLQRTIGHRPLHAAGSVTVAERWVRAGNPDMLAWGMQHGQRAYVRRAESGTSGIAFPDGRLELLETSQQCGCHHDVIDCPHLEPWPEPVRTTTIRP